MAVILESEIWKMFYNIKNLTFGGFNAIMRLISVSAKVSDFVHDIVCRFTIHDIFMTKSS